MRKIKWEKVKSKYFIVTFNQLKFYSFENGMYLQM